MRMGNENYLLYKKLGICPNCRKNMAVSGKVLCKVCADKINAYGKSHRAVNNAAKDRMRVKRKALGLCLDCGAPVLFGHTRCEEHLYIKKVRERVKRLKERKGIEAPRLSQKEALAKLSQMIVIEFIKRGWLQDANMPGMD